MDFLKKHYEKILLGVVLVGLAIAVAALPFKISSERENLQDMATKLTHPRVKELTNLDFTIPDSALKRVVSMAVIDFSSSNRLFNPMPWQQTRETPPRLIPGRKIGPNAATVTNVVPLYLRITLDSVSVSADGAPKYVLGVQKEAARANRDQAKKQSYLRPGEKNDTFKLLEVNGPPDNPTNVVVELNDTGDKVVIGKDQPFKRVDGFMADIKYDPEKKAWPARRVGAALPFNNEEYKIVAITTNEVVLSAPNQKKWTIKSNAPP